DAEEVRVEAEHLVEEAAQVRQFGPLLRERREALLRPRPDQVSAFLQRGPIAVEVMDAAGQPQTGADDRDRRFATLTGVELGAQPLYGVQGAGQRGDGARRAVLGAGARFHG